MTIQIGLWIFESFPMSLLLCNIVHQLSNLSILKTFPYFVLTSPSFIISLGKTALQIIFYLHLLTFTGYFDSFSSPQSLLGFRLFWNKILPFSRGEKLLYTFIVSYFCNLYNCIFPQGFGVFHPFSMDGSIFIFCKPFCK